MLRQSPICDTLAMLKNNFGSILISILLLKRYDYFIFIIVLDLDYFTIERRQFK